MRKEINITVNNKKHNLIIDIRKSLLEVLRDDLGLTGAKEGCGVGECGGCTVIMNGITVDACITLALWADEKEITTIEGITCENGDLSDVQQNFVDSGAVQCGFCTPGLVIAATALLNENKNPNENEIRRGLSGNLCRCTGYVKIIDAVQKTASQRK